MTRASDTHPIETRRSRASGTGRFLFGGLPSLGPLNDLVLAFLRIYAGLAIAIGWGWPNVRQILPSERLVERVTDIGFPSPDLVAIVVSWADFLGGILLALGLLTRPAAAALAAGLLVATFFRDPSIPFLELDVRQALFWITLLFAFAGAGRFSIDASLRRRARIRRT